MAGKATPTVRDTLETVETDNTERTPTRDRNRLPRIVASWKNKKSDP